MSGQATGWVLRHGPRPETIGRDGKAYEGRARGLRAVLVTIADAANRDGEHAHPGLAAIIDGSLYSRRQVQNLLHELEADGWIVVEEVGGGRGRATVYAIPGVVIGNRATTAPADDAKRGNDGPERVQSERETRQRGLHPNGLATEPPTNRASSMDDAAARATRVVLLDGTLIELGWKAPDVAIPGLPEAVRLCRLMGDLLEQRGERVADACSRRWVLDMEQLTRIDGRAPADAERVIRWLHAGADDVASFWRANIRSPEKLRAKWGQMRDQWDRARSRSTAGQLAMGDEALAVVAEAYGRGHPRPGPVSALPSPSDPGGQAMHDDDERQERA